MSDVLSSGDFGFCKLAGHTGSVLLTWDNNTVVKVECSLGNHTTCQYATTCELYNRKPVGYVEKTTMD